MTSLDQGNRGSGARRGATDVVDLLIGIFLALFLPVVCYLVSGVVLSGGAQTSIKDHEEKVLNPPPDQEELVLRWKGGEERLRSTAKTLLKHAESLQDPFMKEQFRIWATRSLKAADGYFVELEKFIKGYPDPDGHYTGYVSNIATLRKEIQADLGRAKSLDYLGVDSGR
jgi:hypothetical protein